MRQLFVLLLILGSLPLFAQDANPVIKDPPFICSYYSGSSPTSITTFNSVDEARTIINNIVNTVGLKSNFEIRAADIPNAAAVIHNNRRFVLYNPRFVARLRKTAKSDWAAVSILAHEIGHHLNGHTLLETGSRPDIELEADEFSGFILRKMGAKLEEAQVAMKIAANVKSSHTHPGRANRLEAIENGWNNADAQIAGKTIVPKTNKTIEKPVAVPASGNDDQLILADKYIAFDVHFSADPKGKYLVTTRNNLVKIEGNNLYIAGTMTGSNRKKYARMIYDKHYNYLYITRAGLIVNGAGKTVGSLKRHSKIPATTL